MFEQKFTNTNEMLQWRIHYCEDFGPPKSGQLNTARSINAEAKTPKHRSKNAKTKTTKQSADGPAWLKSYG
jgi:hypothetical protein